MAIVMTQDLPVPVDVVLQVSKEMGVAENPPDGLIVHVAIPRGDTTHICDVWESREQLERFTDERLAPALAKVLADQGAAMMTDGPEPTIEDARDLVRGR